MDFAPNSTPPSDAERAREIQRRVEAVKHAAEIDILGIQADHARRRSDAITVAQIETAIESIQRAWDESHSPVEALGKSSR